MLILLISLLLAAAAGVVIQEHGERNRSELRRHYLRLILFGEWSGERYLEDLSHLGGQRAKRVASEMAAQLSPIIYKLDEEPLLRLNRMLHLSEFLLRKANSTRGDSRAYNLAILSQLPSQSLTLEDIAPFSNDTNRMVRFFAMVAKINIDRTNLLHYVASYNSPMTPFEISHLIGMLRQGSIVVAYQPMLNSHSLNLNLLGLTIVRQFGIESAKDELYKIVEEGDIYTLRREALYTLVALKMELCQLSVVAFVRAMSPSESDNFLRHVACEGYSQGVIDLFAHKGERQYLHSLINSHKIKIGCL